MDLLQVEQTPEQPSIMATRSVMGANSQEYHLAMEDILPTWVCLGVGYDKGRH